MEELIKKFNLMDLDKRMIRLEISLNALIDRIEYIHKSRKEADDKIVEELVKHSKLLYKEDGTTINGRLLDLEHQMEIERLSCRNNATINRFMLAMLFFMEGWALVKLYLV